VTVDRAVVHKVPAIPIAKERKTMYRLISVRRVQRKKAESRALKDGIKWLHRHKPSDYCEDTKLFIVATVFQYAFDASKTLAIWSVIIINIDNIVYMNFYLAESDMASFIT
jgi:hypothetical protein